MSGRPQRSMNAPPISRFFACAVAVIGLVLGLFSPVSAVAATGVDAARVAGSTVDSRLSSAAGEAVSQEIRPATLVGFTPGNIISDQVFFSRGTMSASSIQSFFNGKVSNCQSGYTCLKNYRQNTPNRPADRYCNGYTGGSNESAATIIYKVSQSCGINPQVLIVMLQKEQGLVTHTWPSDWRYDAALGQGCPDTAPCDPAFRGFFYQIYGAARQMQIYAEGIYFTWYAPGKTWNIRYHPNTSCGSSPVRIANTATAALYYYTPYQPNAAALAAGYGEGNSCSAYGNRNFYNYFTDWFGSTQSTYCAPSKGGEKPAKLAYTVVADSVLARIAPRSNCDTNAQSFPKGTVLQAIRVSGSGDWLEVRTEWGNRWIARSAVVKANAAESKCTQTSGTSDAKLAYVVTVKTPARVTSRAACDLGVEYLEPGAVVRAVTVSGSKLWLKVITEYGERWIQRADVQKATAAQEVCEVPAGVSTAQFAYVPLVDTPLRVTPHASCGASGKVAPEGEAVRAVYGVGQWLKVLVDGKEWWIDRADTRRASTAEGVCVPRAGMLSAKLTYVTLDDITARTAPHPDCAQSTEVAQGTVVQALSATPERDWLLVDLGSSRMWVARDDVRKASSSDLVCTQPTGVKAAKYAYVTLSGTAARTGPGTACADGGQTVAGGEVVRAVAGVDDWLLVRTGSGERWIARSDTRRASTAEAVCVAPSVLNPAKLSYIVTASTTARIAPDTRCATGTTRIEPGQIFTAHLVTADKAWLAATIDGEELWVSRADVRQATALERYCPAPAGTRSAFKTYVVLDGGTIAREAPTTDCDVDATSLPAGTVVTASEVTGDSQWLKVGVGSEQRWIARSDVRYATALDTTCTQPADVNAAKLWYRAVTTTSARLAPTTDCTESSQSLSTGSIVQAVEVMPDKSWLKVRLGTTAKWVPRADLEKVPTATTTSASLNLRAGPSTSASVIATLGQGTIVAVLASDGIWRRVQTHAGEGWLSSDFLR